jgi:hypothetical protein
VSSFIGSAVDNCSCCCQPPRRHALLAARLLSSSFKIISCAITVARATLQYNISGSAASLCDPLIKGANYN